MKVIDTGIVYANPKPYLRTVHALHATIVDLGAGEMLCEFSLAQAQEAVDHLGYQSRSFDKGKTWEFEGRTIPVNTVRPSSHTVRLSNTSTGLVGFGARFWRDDPEKGMIANRDNFGFVPMDLILIRSTDKGKTWSWPETITPPVEGPAFEICHNILELPNGNWLAPCSTQRMDGFEFKERKVVVLISEDKGGSWKDYGVAFDGTREGVTHWESSVCSLGGDDLLAVTWAYHEASATHLPNRFSISHDGGRTFSAPGDIGISGQTCKALRLKDGTILLVYRRNDKAGLWAAQYNFDGTILLVYRRNDKAGLWAAQYNFDGTSWDLLAESLIWDGGLSTSGMPGKGVGSDELSALKFGFPQMLQLESGEIYMVYWCFEGWSCCIRWTKISV